MADLPVTEQTLVGRVTGGHAAALPFATVTEQLGLGKLVAVGHAGLPTWIDPAATDWADVVANNYAWIQFLFQPRSPSGSVINMVAGAGDTPTNGGAFATFSAAAPDYAEIYCENSQGGYVDIAVDGDLGYTYLYIEPTPSQTDPMLTAGDVLEIKPDGTVGGVTPSDGDQLTWDAGSGSIKWKGPLV